MRRKDEDLDYIDPSEKQKRTTKYGSTVKEVYLQHPKLQRTLSGGFEVPCDEPKCYLGGTVHITHLGVELGKSKMAPVCHGIYADWIQSAWLAICGDYGMNKWSVDFHSYAKYLEWGDPTNLSTGHEYCNLANKPTPWASLSTTKQLEVIKYIRQRIEYGRLHKALM